MSTSLLSGARGGYIPPEQLKRLERLSSGLPEAERAALFAHFERIRRGYGVLNALLDPRGYVERIESFDAEARTIAVIMPGGGKDKSDI